VNENLTQDYEEGAEVKIVDPWSSQVLHDNVHEDEEIADDINIVDVDHVD
jgi:hypothetical protein